MTRHRIGTAFIVAAVLAGCGGTEPRRRPRLIFGPGTHILSIEHRDEMSETFRLVRLRVTVDGGEVYVAGSDEDGAQTLPDATCVYRNAVSAGEHEVGVELLYRGRGHGVFSYLSGYRFAVRSTTRADVVQGSAVVHLVAAGVEEGGATAPLEDRPKVRFTTSLEETDTAAGCHP